MTTKDNALKLVRQFLSEIASGPALPGYFHNSTDQAYAVFAQDSMHKANKWLDVIDSALATSDGWQPIETAPKDGTTVLTFRLLNGQPQIADAKFSDGWWGQRSWRYPEKDGPTHWIPLPAAPKP